MIMKNGTFNGTSLPGIQPKDYPLWLNADSLRVGSYTRRGYVNAAPFWRLRFKLSWTWLKVVTYAWDNGHETWSGATATPPVSPCQHHKFTLPGTEQRLWTLCSWVRSSVPTGIRKKTPRIPRFSQLLFSDWTRHVHLSPNPRTKVHVTLDSELNFAYPWILN
jgi:hypothetical protein